MCKAVNTVQSGNYKGVKRFVLKRCTKAGKLVKCI